MNIANQSMSDGQAAAIELQMCMNAVNQMVDMWDASGDEDRQQMARMLFDYIIYDLDQRLIVDFRLKPWADRYLVLRSDLYGDAEASGPGDTPPESKTGILKENTKPPLVDGEIVMFLRLIFALLVVIGLGVTSYAAIDEIRSAPAQELQNPDYELVMVTDALQDNVYLTHAGDDRLFVIEKPGRIRILMDGEVLPEPFLDLTDVVDDGASEKGLLGLAFDPDHANNGRFYVNYTSFDSTTRIERYQASDDPDSADPDSVELILEVAQPFRNHNAGQLAFGPDGYLYVGLGDGGSGGDPNGNGQNLETLLGSMLRLDVAGEAPYEIPADNPFVDDPDAHPEIWAYGLRNPWRYSFDAGTGDLYIADVGQNAVEEVNFQPADSEGGQNYGWNFYEGSSVFDNPPGDREPFTFPIHEYSHDDGCSVTGGYVYRGEDLPELAGHYFFGDFCSGNIWTLVRDGDEWRNELFMGPRLRITSFGVDVEGELYILSFSPSAVWKLVPRAD